LQQGKKSWLGISIAGFAACLLSKEAAVTLPGTLIVMHVLLVPAGSAASRFLAAIRSTAIHTVLLLAYLIFALGYLHVVGMSFAKLLAPPAPAAAEGYDMVFDKTIILANAVLGSTWASIFPPDCGATGAI
jgi:membrane-anchored protein YejM (alkaline phosphatase superfamily)